MALTVSSRYFHEKEGFFLDGLHQKGKPSPEHGWLSTEKKRIFFFFFYFFILLKREFPFPIVPANDLLT